MDQVTVSRELLRRAIDAMTDHGPDWVESERAALVALRTALEQAAVEPVAWMVRNGCVNYQLMGSKAQADALAAEMQKRHDLSGSLASFRVCPLYTAPQAQQPTNQFNPDWDQVKPFLDRIAELEQELQTTTDALGHAQRQHVTDGSVCWCNPTMTYKDPDTGAEVWVHQEPQ